MPRVDLSQIRRQQGSRAHGQQPASWGGSPGGGVGAGQALRPEPGAEGLLQHSLARTWANPLLSQDPPHRAVGPIKWRISV